MTLRADGTYTFYRVQHIGASGRWCDSALARFLFDGLPYEDRRGEKGNHYRRLLTPQSANTDLWQKTGQNGYAELADAEAALAAVRVEQPLRKFRIVQYTITQATIPVAERRAS